MDRETITSFIERYKSHSCLWDVSSPDYMNKNKRINALQDMVPILGESATIDSFRKKIDILRNGYYREHKKVNASLSTGISADNVYTPTLWYYDLMSFLSSQEASRPGIDGLADPERATPSEGISRRKRASTKVQEELVNVAKKLLTEDNPKNAPDRDMTFGLYLNNQLQNLSHDQKIYAEKLMSDVLFLTRTYQLNATSRIFTRQSSQTTTTLNEYSSSPIQFVNSPSPYAENVRSPPNIQRPISQNSAHSASPICHNSPYSEDLPSSPNIQTSSPWLE